jgi:hypothetical protein
VEEEVAAGEAAGGAAGEAAEGAVVVERAYQLAVSGQGSIALLREKVSHPEYSPPDID